MKAIFNHTGTHIKNGLLKVRVDLYPDPTDKTYALHYVSVPVIPVGGYPGKVDGEGSPLDQADYNAWLVGLPHVMQLNPCLCHFIKVPEDINKGQLQAYIEQLFTPDCLATLDEALVQPDSAHRVSPYMKGRPGMAAAEIRTADNDALIATVNARLNELEYNGGKGNSETIEPQSIDIGSDPIDREAVIPNGSTQLSTTVDKNNPANANGTIDTWQIYAETALTGAEVATAYVVSGNNLSTRDYETIGNVSAGSVQTFSGLSTNVITGDYAALKSTTGRTEKTNLSGEGIWWLEADQIPCTNVAFGFYTPRAASFYGTGTEGGGPILQDVGGGGLASASILNRMIYKSPGAGSIGIASTVNLLIKKAIGSGAVGLTGALSNIFKQFKSVGSGSLTSASTLGRMTAKTIGSGAITIAGTVNRLINKTIGSGAVGIASALGRMISKAVGSGSIGLASALGRMIARGVGAGAVGIAGALTPLLLGATVFYQSVGDGAISLSSTLGRTINRAVGSGALTIAGILGRKISLAIGGSVTISGALNRKAMVALGGVLNSAGSLSHKIFITVGAGAASLAGTLGLKTMKIVGAGALSVNATLGRLIRVSVGGMLTSSGILGRKIKLTVGTGAVAMTGVLAATIGLFAQAVGGGAVAIAGSLAGIKIWLARLAVSVSRIRVSRMDTTRIRREKVL